MKYNWEKERLINAVNLSDSYSEVLTRLDIPKYGNNLKTLKNKIKLYDIDVSHFTFSKHYETFGKIKYISATEYLNSNKFINTNKLKQKLLNEGIFENKCSCCGLTSWNGKAITLQLHHIDGNNKNNNLENL